MNISFKKSLGIAGAVLYLHLAAWNAMGQESSFKEDSITEKGNEYFMIITDKKRKRIDTLNVGDQAFITLTNSARRKVRVQSILENQLIITDHGKQEVVTPAQIISIKKDKYKVQKILGTLAIVGGIAVFASASNADFDTMEMLGFTGTALIATGVAVVITPPAYQTKKGATISFHQVNQKALAGGQ